MRARANFLFVSFCLVLILGLLQSFHLFQEHFSPVKPMQFQVAQADRLYQHEKLKVAILETQMYDFQQEIAGLLPNNLPQTKDYQNFKIRSLASVVRKPIEGIDSSTSILDRAKDAFRRSDYKDAIGQFNKLQASYPASPQNVEASFFLAESYFLTGQYQECLDGVDLMMLQYPENELTGFIMLRMGQIFQIRSRFDEAKEVYSSIKRVFVDQRDLNQQADQLLKSVE